MTKLKFSKYADKNKINIFVQNSFVKLISQKYE
jgi:hypothetical protein